MRTGTITRWWAGDRGVTKRTDAVAAALMG